MAGLSDFHAEGVTDLTSYNLGILAERERIRESLRTETQELRDNYDLGIMAGVAQELERVHLALLRIQNQYTVDSNEYEILGIAIAIVKREKK